MRAHSEDKPSPETLPVRIEQPARFRRGMKRPDGRHWAGPPHSPLLSVTSSRNPFAVTSTGEGRRARCRYPRGCGWHYAGVV